MRFSTAALTLGAAAIVSAQSSTTSAWTPSSSQEACLKNCNADDVNCKAHCITVPSPNDAQANKTTECAKNCNQGDGSAAQSEAFGKCIQDCIATNYYNPQDGTPNGSGGNSGSNGSGNSGSNTAGGAGGAGGASATGSGANAGATGGAGGSSSGAGNKGSSATSTASGSGAAATTSGAEASKTGDANGKKNDAAGLASGTATFFGLVAALFAL